MVADPPVRDDGACAECGGPRPRPPAAGKAAGRAGGLPPVGRSFSKASKGANHADASLDPFCSSACCRAWHGVELLEGHDLIRRPENRRRRRAAA